MRRARVSAGARSTGKRLSTLDTPDVLALPPPPTAARQRLRVRPAAKAAPPVISKVWVYPQFDSRNTRSL